MWVRTRSVARVQRVPGRGCRSRNFQKNRQHSQAAGLLEPLCESCWAVGPLSRPNWHSSQLSLSLRPGWASARLGCPVDVAQSRGITLTTRGPALAQTALAQSVLSLQPRRSDSRGRRCGAARLCCDSHVRLPRERVEAANERSVCTDRAPRRREHVSRHSLQGWSRSSARARALGVGLCSCAAVLTSAQGRHAHFAWAARTGARAVRAIMSGSGAGDAEGEGHEGGRPATPPSAMPFSALQGTIKEMASEEIARTLGGQVYK